MSAAQGKALSDRLDAVEKTRKWKKICDITLTEEASGFEMETDAQGDPLSLQEICFFLSYTNVSGTGSEYLNVTLNSQATVMLHQGLLCGQTAEYTTKANVWLYGRPSVASYPNAKRIDSQCWVNTYPNTLNGLAAPHPAISCGKLNCNAGEINRIRVNRSSGVLPVGTRLIIEGR